MRMEDSSMFAVTRVVGASVTSVSGWGKNL